MGKAKEAPGNGKKKGDSVETSASNGRWSLVILIAVVIALLAVTFEVQRRGTEATVDQLHQWTAEPGVRPPVASGSAPVVASGSAPVASVASPVVSNAPQENVDASFAWKPKTLSVVLPCAGEGQFARRTVESVAKSVPGGIGGKTLAEIIVVDDGSNPPLSEDVLTKDFRKKFPVTIVRHKEAVGLMGAKSAGAAEATGDVIVFFDCHVAPQGKWYQEFLTTISDNYRRIVMPVITDLDIDTWQERKHSRGGGLAKCYLTWDADFKWIEMEQPHMPVLSGGLLGISRRWWNETGGYDSGMKGWGGENIDQSLRTWLCGGEIISLPKAFVAHMWRKPEDKRTDKNYDVSALDALKNKARAVLGWFDAYTEKAAQFQALNWLGLGSRRIKNVNAMMGGMKPPSDLNTDVSNLHAIRDGLKCKPFAWFLWRFRHIYVDGGMLPPQTYQLQEVSSGLCLTFLGPMGVHPQGRAHASLLPCNNTGLPAHVHSESQRWHMRNKQRKTGKCCSAIGSWNTDQCIVSLGEGGVLVTSVCDVSGRQVQAWGFTEEPTDAEREADPKPRMAAGQITFGGKCLTVDKKAPTIQITPAANSPVLTLSKCKAEKKGSTPKPKWRKVGHEVPMETELYETALREQPGLFVE